MQILGAVFGLFFLIAIILVFLWMVVGLPAGVVLVVMYFLEKDKTKKAKKGKWILICFGSILAMIGVTLLWSVFRLVGFFFGGPLTFSVPST